MTYGEYSEWFMKSFWGGSADQKWEYLNNHTIKVTNLKINRQSEPIPVAIVKFKQGSYTVVTDEGGNVLHTIQTDIKPDASDEFYELYKSSIGGYQTTLLRTDPNIGVNKLRVKIDGAKDILYCQKIDDNTYEITVMV